NWFFKKFGGIIGGRYPLPCFSIICRTRIESIPLINHLRRIELTTIRSIFTHRYYQVLGSIAVDITIEKKPAGILIISSVATAILFLIFYKGCFINFANADAGIHS